MNDPNPIGLDAAGEAEWGEFFRSGRVFTAPVDRGLLARRSRINTAMLVTWGAVAIVALVVLIASAVTGFGRELTYVLLGVLVAVSGFVFLKFWFNRRRLRAGRGSGDDFLVVSADRLRVAGLVELPWASVFGGIGYDTRSTGGRLGVRVTRAAGVPEAEFVLGVRGIREIRDAAPAALRGIFEVIGAHGGIRIPLDTLLASEHVRTSLAAIYVAGRLAGARMMLSNDSKTLFSTTTAVLGDPAAFTRS